MAGKGRPGPAPKPAERKRTSGNPGKRNLPEPAPVVVPALTAPPPAPEHLGDRGIATWQRVWASAIGWLASSDTEVVTLLCQAVDERAALVAVVAREGPTFVTDKGYVGVHPALSELRKLDSQLTTWFSLLGLTPADRSRLGFAEVRRVSKLAELRERMAAPLAEPPGSARSD